MSAMTKFTRRLLSGLSLGLSHARRLATNNKANISILAGVTFIPFTIAVTAAVDLSNAIRIKTSLQAAADAGVLAAATAMASGYGDSDKTKIATDTFFANLSPQMMKAFPADPEVVIDFANKSVHMDVTVNTDQLLTNLITDAITIGVQSTAVADQGSPVCLMSLNPTRERSLHIQGTADVNALACAVQVNSSHNEAMRQIGSSKAVAESYCVHGSYTGSNYTPMPRRHCMRQQDPLAEQFAIDLANTNLTGPCKNIQNRVENQEVVRNVHPGVYCGGLDIRGEVYLRSGTHVFLDHGLNITSGGALKIEPGDTGGVTLLMAGPNSRFENRAGADIDVTAPSSGRFAGIVLASHPDTVPPSNKKNTIIGGGQMEFNGIVYFPTQELKITGNGDIGADSAQFAIMADMIDIDGNGTLFIHISADAADAGLPGLPTTQEVIRLVK